MGSEKMENGELKGFGEFTFEEWGARSIFSIKQDARQLDGKIVELGFMKIPEIFKKHNLSSEDLVTSYYICQAIILKNSLINNEKI